MNVRTNSRPGRLLVVLALSLLLVCLLFLGLSQFQQPAYSQGLTSPPMAENPAVMPVATPTRMPCAGPGTPTPVPPGDPVKIVGDDEIFLAFRQADDSQFLTNYIIDNPVGSTQLQTTGSAYTWSALPRLEEVGWLSADAADLNGDHRAEFISSFKNHSSQVGALSWSDLIVNPADWYNDGGRVSGGTLSWIDVAAGDLDRGHDNDEFAIAFKDDYSDYHVVVLDGKSSQPGAIGPDVNTQLSEFWSDVGERGSINHAAVETGDLNGDGSNDEIVVAFKDGGSDLQVSILRLQNTTLTEIWSMDSRENGRDNTASAASGAWSNKWPIDVTTGDLDGDMMDEVVVAFRIGDAKGGDIQLLVLDVTDPNTTPLTVDSRVWLNHDVPNKYHEAATAVSVSAADLDGDGYDEIALAYNATYEDSCESGGGTYVCNLRWQQHLVTYEYVPFAAPEHPSWCAGKTLPCLYKHYGPWNSTVNYGHDISAEGLVVVATGDLDRDTKAEIALAHFKWETDDVEVISFDADSSTGLKERSRWVTDLGSNRPWEFWISMGDRNGDSQYADYTDVCYIKTEAQVIDVIYAPPHWPEEHIAANSHHAAASFGMESLVGGGTTDEYTSKIGGSLKIAPQVHEVGPSFTYEFEYEASSEQKAITDTVDGAEYSTCSAVFCGEEANYTGIQILETTSDCFVYHEATAGDMDVCLPVYTRVLPYSQNWWYTTGYRTYPESWVPVGNNLAEGRKAEQSSDDASYPAPAARAVDGDVNGAYSSGHVSHTGYDDTLPTTSWWEVDLGGVQWIGAVQVWNRTDAGYTNRLKDFYVFVSEEPIESDDVNELRNSEDLWKHYVSGEAGRPTIVPVDHHGRYVRVQLFGPDAGPCNTDHENPDPCNPSIQATAKNYLDMAELQVFGMPGAVDQWPKAKPASSGSDKFTLVWRDPNVTSGITQIVPGQILAVKPSKISVAPSTQGQHSSLGFGRENETINASSTSQEMSLGMEVKWVGADVTAGSSQKHGYIFSWEKTVGFYGEVAGLPDETTPPTMCWYQYDFYPYAWLQRSTSSGGVNQAFMVGGYYVDQIGPYTGVCPPAAPGSGQAITPSVPLLSSPTHPDPATWVASNTATFNWSQPSGDQATIAGYNWQLDESEDTIPHPVNFGPITTQTYEKLADGVWYMHVRAVGDGDLWGDTAHRAIRVDANPPEVQLALDPGQPSGDNDWYVTPVTVAVSASDGEGSGVANVEYSTDGASWQAYATPLVFGEDTAGTTVYARATDAIGQVSEPVTATLKIDRTPSDSHVSGGDGPGAWVARVLTDSQGNQELVLAGAIAEDLSGRSGMSLEYDGLDWTSATPVGSWPLPDRPEIEVNWYFTATHEIGAGYHIFLGRAQDVAGNLEAPYEIARVLWYPLASPDISGSSVTASRTAIRPGEVVTFTVVARNAGWQEAHVSVVDTLPAGLTPVTTTVAADVSYDPATGTLTWPAQLLWPGQWVQHSFQAQAAEGLPATTLENTATLHAFWPNTDLLPAGQRQPFLDREQTVAVTATVAVHPSLPAGADRTPPWAILARGTQGPVTSPQVQLGISAESDAARMYLREWTPDPMTGAWTVAQNSGWMDYARTITWTLSAGQGVKYLGVWVADGAGNVSTLDEHSLIYLNRIDGSQSLADGQRVQYRAYVEEGMEFLVGLKTVSGDPDLYAWRPRNAFWPDRYTQATLLPGQVEESGYQVAQQSGRYLLEVQAVGASEYELIAAGPIVERAEASRAPEAKQRPQHPLVVSDPLSAGQVGPVDALQPKIYLPLMFRN